MNARIKIETRTPKAGENQMLRWNLTGSVNGLPISIPFASNIEARRFAEERGWVTK
jgi:hypothetical protein